MFLIFAVEGMMNGSGNGATGSLIGPSVTLANGALPAFQGTYMGSGGEEGNQQLAGNLEKCLGPLEQLEETRSTEQSALSSQMLSTLTFYVESQGGSKPQKSAAAANGAATTQAGAEGGDQYETVFRGCDFADWEHAFDYEMATAGIKEPELGEEWRLEHILSLLKRVRTQPDDPLHPKFVLHMLVDVERQMAKKSGPIRDMNVPEPGGSNRGRQGRLVVVGDTHGQLEDVLWIFFKNHLPSPSNAYLFNGDVADRGVYAMEIFLLIFGFMLLYPDNVVMNRGNHEDETINLDAHCGGFYEELLCKYGPDLGGKIHGKMCEIYSLLPLATVINKKIFVVHGGLSRQDGMFELLGGIEIRDGVIPEEPRTPQEMVYVDAMWADPSENPGITPSARGTSLINFGPDVTLKFLKKNNFNLIVRSHQPPPDKDGVYMHHEGRLATVFSASNYCGWYGNQGGVIIFSGSSLHVQIGRHYSPSFEMLAEVEMLSEDVQGLQAMQRRTKEQRMEQKARSNTEGTGRLDRAIDQVKGKVARLFVEHHEQLWNYFCKHLPHNNRLGLCTVEEWEQGLKMLFGDVPWQWVNQILDIQDEVSGLVDWEGALHRFFIVFDEDVMKEQSDISNAAQMRKYKSSRSSAFIRGASRSGSVVSGIRSSVGSVCSTSADEKTNIWMEVILAKLYENLLQSGSKWEEICEQFGAVDGYILVKNMPAVIKHAADKGKLGKVTRVGLTKDTDGGVTMTSAQAEALVRTITAYGPPTEDSSKMAVAEFLMRLEVVFTGFYSKRYWSKQDAGMVAKNRDSGDPNRIDEDAVMSTPPTMDPKTRAWAASVMRLIGRVVQEEVIVQAGVDPNSVGALSATMVDLFKHGDADGSGFIERAEFKTVIENIVAQYPKFSTLIKRENLGEAGGIFTDEMFEALWSYADVAHNNKLNYLEFLHSFQPEYTADFGAMHNMFGVVMMQQVTRLLYANKSSLMKAFQFYDPDRTLTISKDEFRTCIQVLNQVVNPRSPNLANDQIEVIIDHCVFHEGGTRIHYKSFLDCMVLCDNRTGETWM